MIVGERRSDRIVLRPGDYKHIRKTSGHERANDSGDEGTAFGVWQERLRRAHPPRLTGGQDHGLEHNASYRETSFDPQLTV